MDFFRNLPKKTYTLFKYVAKSLLLFICPSSKSTTAGESFYTSQNFPSAEAIEKIGKAMAEGDLQKVLWIAKDEMQRKSRHTLKIAVTGDSGNGMSSFLNALRLIGHEEEDSAPTGVVRTTQTPSCYSSSRFPLVELWDLPGTGATAQTMESYLDEMQFSTCDLIIIIASEQFSSNHVKLAKAMQSMRKRFYVVWTKLDRDLSTSTLDEPQLLESIIKNIRENLQNEEVKEPPIFLVSCFRPLLHDFSELRNTLQKDIFSIRYLDTLETLSEVCNQCISNKACSLQKDQMFMKHLEAGHSPPYNTAVLERVFQTYQKLFGVDEVSLWRVAQSIGRPEISSRVPRLQDMLRRYRILSLMMSFPVNRILRVLASSWWFGLWNFVICYYRYKTYTCIIDIVAKETKTFLRGALKDYTLPPEIHG